MDATDATLNLSKGSEQEKIYTASQWQLVRWRFARHKAAIVSLILLGCFYGIAVFCEFVAPHDPIRNDIRFMLAPPRKIHFVDERGFNFRPFVYGLKGRRDPETLRMVYEEDASIRYPIHFFQHGDEYKFWGIWKADLHLFGVENKDELLVLFGGDLLGRDVFSRVIYGSSRKNVNGSRLPSLT